LFQYLLAIAQRSLISDKQLKKINAALRIFWDASNTCSVTTSLLHEKDYIGITIKKLTVIGNSLMTGIPRFLRCGNYNTNPSIQERVSRSEYLASVELDKKYF
jgi:hypothetical protein